MRSNVLKIAISILVLAGGLGYLMYTSLAENLEYYKYPNEIASDEDRWIDVRLRLAGKVEEGSIFNKPGTHEYLFSVVHDDVAMPVRFSGAVPDSFAEKADVVVSGRLGREGYFEADRVFARCPSKYEAEPMHPMFSGRHGSNLPGEDAHERDLELPSGHPRVRDRDDDRND